LNNQLLRIAVSGDAMLFHIESASSLGLFEYNSHLEKAHPRDQGFSNLHNNSY
jgi:hypothetical protein